MGNAVVVDSGRGTGPGAVRLRTSDPFDAATCIAGALEGHVAVSLLISTPGAEAGDVLRHLQSRRAGASVVSIDARQCTFERLIDELLRRLGARAPAAPLLVRLHQLTERLLELQGRGRSPVLVVENADELDDRLLAELAILSSRTTDARALLPLLLLGSERLEPRLRESAGASLGGHLGLTIHLDPPPPPAPRLPVTTETRLPVERRAGATPPFLRRWMLFAVTAGLVAGVAVATISGRSPTSLRHLLPVSGELAYRGTPTLESTHASSLRPDVARTGPVSADEARAVVNRFRRALLMRDSEGLSDLLAPDAEHNGVRGREAVVETYAYRFARIDGRIDVAAPTRIVLRDGDAIVSAPFLTAYRDASGTPGAIEGITRWHIVRQDGRARVLALDYEFEAPTDE